MTKPLLFAFIFFLLFMAGAQAQNSPPILISPTDSAKNQQPVVTCRWKADTTAIGFTLEVSTSSGFSSSNTNTYKNITATSYRITSLSASTTYYWRVKAYFNGGDSTDFSDIFLFKTGDAPTAKFDISKPTVCVNNTVSLKSVSSGLAPMTYSWTFSGGSISSSISANPNIYFTSAGTYTVTLTVTNAFGSNTATDYIEVLESITNSSITRKDKGKCAGAGVELTVNSTGTFYKWSNGATTKSITVYDTGFYGVVVSNGACNEYVYTRIDYKVFPLKVVASSDICYGDSVLLDAGDGFISYKWNTGETTRSIYIKNADSIFYVRAISADSCPYFGSIAVKYKYDSAFRISVEGLNDYRICSGNVSLSVAKIPGLGKVKWSTGDTTNSIIISSPGYYSATAEDANGCKAKTGLDVYFQKVKCMSGIYTIGGTNPDFNTIEDAVQTLNENLIVGDITLNIRDGVYTNKYPLDIGFFGNWNGKYNITFQSESADATKVKIDNTYNSTIGIQIYSPNISLKNLTILNSGNSTYAVYVAQAATRARFEGNIIIDNSYTDYSTYEGKAVLYIMADSAIVSRNSFYGGAQAISITNANNAIIENNKFGGQAKNLIFISNAKNIRISNNATAFYQKNGSGSLNITAINLNNVQDFIIEGNIFHESSPNSNYSYLHYGAQLNSCSNSDSALPHVYNNIFYGSMFGLYIASSTNLNIFHNNIYSNNRGVYLDRAYFIGLINNNVHNGVSANGNKYSFRTIQTNNYYPKPTLGNAIPEAVNLDGNSKSVDPLYPDYKELFAKNKALDKAGTVINEIATDIHDRQRDMQKADIGAEELLEINDIALDSILIPTEKCGATANEALQFSIRNLSNLTTQTIPAGIGNITFGYKINNEAPVSLISNLSQPQTISYLGNYVMVYPNQLNLETPGKYNIKVWVSMYKDVNRENDTLSIIVNSKPSAKSAFDFTGLCIGNITNIINQTTYTGSEPQYTWIFHDGSTQTGKNASYKYTELGTYSVKLISVSSSGCTDIITKSVTIYPYPEAIIERYWNTLISTTYGTRYQWLFNGEPIDSANSYEYIAEKNGKYTLIVTNAGGCSDTSEEYNFIYTGLEDESLSNKIEIYPNPTNGKTVISGLESVTKLNTINIYDVVGKCIYNKAIPSNTSGNIALDLGSIKAGVYWLQLTGDNKKINKKLVVY